ncbi:carbon-nitrogen hydrolase family protein [Chloroflexota bacterium]
MPYTVKIAAVQMNPRIMQNKDNLDKILLEIRASAGNNADLIVFPECALSGYVFSSREEAVPYMETIPGPSTDELATICKELGVHIIVGMLEIDSDRCFNAAVLIGPDGLVGKYRKNHLPFLGIDRFMDPGDQPFQVYGTPVGNIGMHICYDCNFPESARIMTLLGADILALPTNWPEGREKVAKYVINTRAFENKVHIVAVDRVGNERGTRFIGNSKIVNAQGDTLIQAGDSDEQTVYAEVILTEARQKRTVFKAGEFECDFIGDRRPELYGKIAEANGL